LSASGRGLSAALSQQALWRLALSFATGAFLNLAFAPFGWWPLACLAPAVLFALVRGLPPRRAAWVGAAFGTGLFSFGTYWIYICFHGHGHVPIWLTLFLQAGLVAIMAAYYASLCYLANRFWLKPGVTRDWLVLPALWVLLEWLRGWLFSGFPWLSLGYAFTDAPLAGWAPILGVYGISLAAGYAAVAVYVLLAPGISLARRLQAGAVLIAVFVAGSMGLRVDWTHEAGAKLPVAAVQGNVPEDDKWQLDNRAATIKRYFDLTEQAWGARLIVWPEAALPVLATEIPGYLNALETAGRQHDADFVIGLINYEPESNHYFNGVRVLGDQGGWYYKRHLVPFGEYFPVPSFVRAWMRLMNLPYDDITAGSEHQPLLSAAAQPLGLTICYEDSYGSSQLRVLRQATLLINVTNDAWFGDSTARHQHLQISRLRALEAGRYLIRAANDGITAIIGPRGQMVAVLPGFQQAVLRADVVPMTGLTPYARWGNYPIVIGAGLLLAWAVWRRRRAA
jgi:apolipoprotein N-acyltransferase